MGDAGLFDRYQPRRLAFDGVWRTSAAHLKLYTISATDEPMDHHAVSAAYDLIEAEGAASGCGFVILHRGEEALWLLLHWWLPGGILAEQLWSSPLVGPLRFEEQGRPLMACVWELTPIAFERDAYVDTVMRDGRLDDYMNRALDDGLY